jgi:hypothetical protein
MSVMDGYHPRAVVMVHAFGPRMRHASVAGLVAGVTTAVVLGVALSGALHGLATMALVTIGTVLAGTAAAFMAVPRPLRRAFEAYSWLGRRETIRFRATTASPVPLGAPAVRDWLAANPVSPITGEARVELLVAIGQFAQARAEFEALPRPATDLERVGRAGLRTWGEVVATGEVDLGAFDAAVASVAPGSEAALEATVVRALAQSRVASLRGDPDALRPLRDVRPALGRDATLAVVRDAWFPLARSLAAFGLAIGAIAALARVGWWG